MEKNYFFIIFLFVSSFAFSQTDTKPSAVPETTNQKSAVEPVPQAILQTTPALFEKNPLPIEKKGAPAIFYIENDKPVDWQTYRRHLKQATSTN